MQESRGDMLVQFAKEKNDEGKEVEIVQVFRAGTLKVQVVDSINFLSSVP